MVDSFLGQISAGQVYVGVLGLGNSGIQRSYDLVDADVQVLGFDPDVDLCAGLAAGVHPADAIDRYQRSELSDHPRFLATSNFALLTIPDVVVVTAEAQPVVMSQGLAVRAAATVARTGQLFVFEKPTMRNARFEWSTCWAPAWTPETLQAGLDYFVGFVDPEAQDWGIAGPAWSAQLVSALYRLMYQVDVQQPDLGLAVVNL